MVFMYPKLHVFVIPAEVSQKKNLQMQLRCWLLREGGGSEKLSAPGSPGGKSSIIRRGALPVRA